MFEGAGEGRDLSTLVVPVLGVVEAGDDLWEPVRLVDSGGEPVSLVMVFLRELQASGRSAATHWRTVPSGAGAGVPSGQAAAEGADAGTVRDARPSMG